MAKAVLISIQPKWCELIASGKKMVEIRKNKPKLETPFKCYIYQTKGGNVIGEFVCDEIERFSIDPKYDNITLSRMSFFSCVTTPQLQDYASDYWLYGWRISGLLIYDTPKKLSEFMKPCESDLYCESCAMFREFEDRCGNAALNLHRPPQSWCYVEEDDHA